MKIALIGDYASQNFLIGNELTKRGFDVSYFIQTSELMDRPKFFYNLGNIQGSLWKNYLRTGFWMFMGKIIKNFDIIQINGTYPQCVRGDNASYHYHGSELRSGKVQPSYPSFISTRDLLKYAPKSVFLPRCVDTNKFYPDEEMKEVKESFKSFKGIDSVIKHFASNPEIRNSSVIIQAIDEINKEGDYKIDFITKKSSRDLIPKTINYCDMILDHANPKMETYGVISIEALMCGVTTGSYYTSDNIDFKEMKKQVVLLKDDSELIKKSIIENIRFKRNIDINLIKKYHSPEATVDVLMSSWIEWGFI